MFNNKIIKKGKNLILFEKGDELKVCFLKIYYNENKLSLNLEKENRKFNLFTL